MLVIPGTGQLTDAHGCRLFLVSVGTGSVYSVLGQWLVKSILELRIFDPIGTTQLGSISAADVGGVAVGPARWFRLMRCSPVACSNDGFDRGAAAQFAFNRLANRGVAGPRYRP